VIDTKIASGDGNGKIAKVSRYGQLVTAPIDYSLAYNATAAVANTAYNLVGPVSGKRFVIDSILLYANKNVGAGDATVEVYEATGADVTAVSKSIFTAEMVKQTSRDITGVNIIVSAGKWVNVKTDDDDVFATITGYYVDIDGDST
jgi:hypothetical protein